MTSSKIDKAELINKLRETLAGYKEHFTDDYLEQYLIARSWDVQAAHKQLTNTLTWRKENEVDLFPVATRENGLPLLYPIRGFQCLDDTNLTASPGVAESTLRIYEHMGGYCLHKTDKDGCPVYIERVGYHAAKEIAKYTKIEEVVNYHIGCNEFLHRVIMKHLSQESNKTINRETVVFDCTGMGWHQFHMPALQYLRAISDIDQKYYPETLNRLFIINAPSAFVFAWKIIKKWLDEGTIKKIQILGSDFQDALLDQIPAENLPKFLGGDCECSHMAGGCVPSHVLKNIDRSEPTETNDKTATPYNDDIMQRAKWCASTKGPDFYHAKDGLQA